MMLTSFQSMLQLLRVQTLVSFCVAPSSARAVFTVLMAASIEAMAANAPALVLTLKVVMAKAPWDAEMADI